MHDSTKGYTHGCIEVDPRFFSILRSYVNKTKKKRLYLQVDYGAGGSTYGGTKKP